MVFHITQGFANRFNLTMADALPAEEKVSAMHLLKIKKWDPLVAWGIKGFDFGKYKCFQMLNFATKFSLFVFNVEDGSVENLGDIIWEYMNVIYAGDEEMLAALEKYFTVNRYSVFTPLLDKPSLASLVRNEQMFTNLEKLGKYVDGGVLQTKKLNTEYNKGYLVARIFRGKTEFIVPADRFRQLVIERFGGDSNE